MKKIIFGLLCFGLINVSTVNDSFAKQSKRSAAYKKRQAYKKRRAHRKQKARYRAYKSFYRSQIKRLNKKTNWSFGIFSGVSANKELYRLTPLGVSLAYHINSFVSIEERLFFSYSELTIPDTVESQAEYKINTGFSFSTLVKIRKSIDRQKAIMPYVLAGYSILKVIEGNICKNGERCLVSENTQDINSEKIGLFVAGVGVDFFPIKRVSVGLEAIKYFGVQSAMSKGKSFGTLSDLDLKDFVTLQISARYYF